MKPTDSQPFTSQQASLWVLAGALLALMLILATLQYRWLNEVSEADRQKTRDVLHTAVTRFAEDFDRELTLAYLYLQPRSGWRAPDDDYAERYERWRAYAAFPGLVRAIFIARSEASDLELSRFDPVAGLFTTAPWPEDLSALHEGMKEGFLSRLRSQPPDEMTVLVDNAPALILPLLGFPPPGGPDRPERLGRPDSFPFGRGFIILWLDHETISQVILPQLTERYLRGGDGVAYHARVIARDDQRQIFQGGDAMTGSATNDGDASADLFSLLPWERLASLGIDPERSWGGNARGSRDGGPPDHRSGRRGPRFGEGRWFHRFYGFISQQESPKWRLVVSHPSGSLDAAITRAHRNNLAISFGILLLLAASMVLILRSTRRMQALAKQQLEFVAGVTHELLTPLAAMRSAGQNLADGVVEDDQQVKRYGRLIEDEGRRLTGMVGQVLEFAGMQAGRRTYSLHRVRLPEVVNQALAEYRSILDDKGFEVEARIDPDLPEIMADPPALRRAIQNLIGNAIKYGRAGSWIGLEARSVAAGNATEIQLSVADRGPGITAGDLSRLFEPFYRGSDVSVEQIPGSGLGLSIVQHIALGHGGRVAVATRKGEGSTFTLHLPAVADSDTSDDGDTSNERNSSDET